MRAPSLVPHVLRRLRWRRLALRSLATGFAALVVAAIGAGQASATTTYSAEVLADSPAVYWRFGEASGSTAADASGHSHPGSYQQPVTLGTTGALAGDTDTAITLGSNGYVSSGFHATDLSSLSGRTWEAWVKPGAGHALAAVLTMDNGNQYAPNWAGAGLYIFGTSATFWEGTSSTISGGATGVIDPTVWTHLV